MLAALFLIGTSIAVGAFAGVGMEYSDDEIDNDPDENEPSGIGLDLLGDGGFETLVGDPIEEGPLVSEEPSTATLVSDLPEVVTMIGEGVAGAFGLDAPDVLSPIGDESDLEGLEPGWAETLETEAVVSDADVPDGAEVLEWTSAQEPVEITDFVPGEDILSITIIAEQGIDGVDVEIAPSADGLDGEVRANDQLLAVIRGAPDIEPDAFQFDLVGGDEDTASDGDAVDTEAAEGSAVSDPVPSEEGGSGVSTAPEDDGHPGKGKGHAYGHDKAGGGRGHAYAYGHDKMDDGGSNGKGKR